GPDVLTQTEVRPTDGEKYPDANPAVLLPPALRKLAIIDFSGRYDLRETLATNLARPRDIFFVASNDIPTRGPAKIIFKSNDQDANRAIAKPGVSVRYIPNIFGEPLYTEASFPASN